MITPPAQKEIQALQAANRDARVLMIAEKGTMGVDSSRMSGVNNVALWTGKPASPDAPFVTIAPMVAGANGISPIFFAPVDVTGGIGRNGKNWVKMTDAAGKPVLNAEGNPVLEQTFSVASGTVLGIDTKARKLHDAARNVLVDRASAFTPQRAEFMRAGGS